MRRTMMYEPRMLTTASIPAKQPQGRSFYMKVAEAMAEKAGVTLKFHDDGVQGIPWVRARLVEGPRPLSRRRLAFLGYLIGYIVEAAYSESETSLRYRAWLWVISQLEENGLRVPRRTLKNAKRDLAYLLHRQVVDGASEIEIDVDASRWCEPYLSQRVKGVIASMSVCAST